MKSLVVVFVVAFLGITVFTDMAQARALVPKYQIGVACEYGSCRRRTWMVYEDLDGNGHYDHVAIANCDGTFTFQQTDVGNGHEFEPSGTATQIGVMQLGVLNSESEFTADSNSFDSGWHWKVIDYVIDSSGDVPVCGTGRSEAGVLSVENVGGDLSYLYGFNLDN